MDSILTTIKKMLGLSEEYDSFDLDIIALINTALGALTQLGVGPEEGYSIVDANNTWDEFLGESKNLEMVKTFVYMKTKLMFDPPANGTLVDVYTQHLKELEFRINAIVDTGDMA